MELFNGAFAAAERKTANETPVSLDEANKLMTKHRGHAPKMEQAENGQYKVTHDSVNVNDRIGRGLISAPVLLAGGIGGTALAFEAAQGNVPTVTI